MFINCARLERNVFVTWKENDVNEQDVDERKRVLRKKKSVESYLGQILTKSLTSSNHYAEYSLACTANWLELQPY